MGKSLRFSMLGLEGTIQTDSTNGFLPVGVTDSHIGQKREVKSSKQ